MVLNVDFKVKMTIVLKNDQKVVKMLSKSIFVIFIISIKILSFWTNNYFYNIDMGLTLKFGDYWGYIEQMVTNWSLELKCGNGHFCNGRRPQAQGA